MLSLHQLNQNKEHVLERLKIKGIDATEKINSILELDELRKKTQKRLDDILAESNLLAKEIGQLFKTKAIEKANEVKKQTSLLKEESKTLNQKLQETIDKIQEEIIEIPNIPHESVKAGKDETDNELIKTGDFNEKLLSDIQGTKPHWDVASKADIIDFELGNKITGAGFPLYKGKGAKLQRALINFFLEEAIENGYHEIQAPLMVNEDTAYGTGQLPDKEGQMYHVTEDNFYLIPTAEVPLTNIYRNEIIDEKDLPVKLTGYTACFRREAGSYGKNVRGLNRLHQFDKVEIVHITKPELSYQTLEEMVTYVESLLKKLQLPYRILRLCGKDLSFTSALTYDFEIFSAAQERWLEVSSVSNFETFQSNRMKIRYRNDKKKNQLVHTLNGSALALPRIMAGILENYQDESGIKIPEVLRPFTGFDKISY